MRLNLEGSKMAFQSFALVMAWHRVHSNTRPTGITATAISAAAVATATTTASAVVLDDLARSTSTVLFCSEF